MSCVRGRALASVSSELSGNEMGEDGGKRRRKGKPLEEEYETRAEPSLQILAESAPRLFVDERRILPGQKKSRGIT